MDPGLVASSEEIEVPGQATFVAGSQGVVIVRPEGERLPADQDDAGLGVEEVGKLLEGQRGA